MLSSPDVKKLFKSLNYVQSNIIAQSQLYYQQNNMFNCYVSEFFTRQFSLKRHIKRKHAQPNVESMIESPKIHQFTENCLILQHPFTMMVAASTGGGKTCLVKDLLENRQQFLLHHSESYGSMVSGSPCVQRCRESYQA